MSNVKLAVALVFGLGVSMCIADEADSKSSPKASLVASLLGDAENPVLSIRLRNTGDVPIMVDKELVFLPDLVMVDNERRAIPFKEIRAIEKPTASVLKNRLVTLKPGEKIERQVHLRKGFKQFVTGISTPVRLGGSEAPKVTAYETFCQMPADARPFEIEVSYNPWYSFEEGFAQYMEGINVTQFYREPLRVSLAYKFGHGAKKTQGGHGSLSRRAEGRGGCKEPNRPPVSIALCEIRIKPDRGEETLEANVHLLLCNQSEKAICVLPSQGRLSYNIYYDNGEFDFEGSRSQTIQSPEPKDISDLDVKSVVVAPGGTANLVFDISVQPPKGQAGRLELEYQCEPSYPGASYRGTTLYRDVLQTTTEVAVTKAPKTGEILIRPVARPGCRVAPLPKPPVAADSQNPCKQRRRGGRLYHCWE